MKPTTEKPKSAIYDESIGGIYNYFPNFVTLEEFIFRCESVLTILEEKKCTKLIIDGSELGVMGTDKKDYVEKIWFEKALKLGLKVVANIVPKDSFGKFGMKNANKKAQEDMPFIKMQYFEDLDKAKAWVKSVE